ncbi:MAG TPA: hypothetical protein VGA97_06275, partial [Acidimicrobiia bacterium]
MTRADVKPLLAIVPARGGSQGIRGKNLRPLKGKPLILHTLETLADVAEIDRVVVSTDSLEIGSFARVRGYEYLPRDQSLAMPDTTLSEVAIAIVRQLAWDGEVGVFQPTSPFRTSQSVRSAIREFRESGCASLSSAVRERHLFWLDEGEGDLNH